jgi:hypothetical protein
MANELTFSTSLQFSKGNIAAQNLQIQNVRGDAGEDFVRESQTITTAAGGTAINLGPVTAPGAFAIKNNDATNYVEILPAVSGTPMLKILPGEVAQGRFTSTVTAPAVKANTASVDIEYLIVQDEIGGGGLSWSSLTDGQWSGMTDGQWAALEN